MRAHALSDRGVRLALSAAAGGASLIANPGELGRETALPAAVWAALALALSSDDGRKRSTWLGAAHVGALAAWAVHPASWLRALVLIAVAHTVSRLAGVAKTRGPPLARGLLALSLGAPGALSGLILATGGPGALLIRTELATAFPHSASESFAACAGLLAAWASLWLAVGRFPTSGVVTRASSGVVLCGVAALVFVRARWMLSVLPFPLETQWSEAPHLLNAWKLSLGRPMYGPLADCNSYSYSPLLELVHRAVLAPLGLALSLPANRCLNLLWHALSTAALVLALGPVPGEGTPKGRVGVAMALALVTTSSFLAANLHPDHLTTLGFALAIGLVARETRLQPRVFEAGLLLVPAYCTMAKLTGAGVGLGLVFCFLRPFRPRPLLVLAAGALLAIATVPLFDATLGPFSTYAIALQASHRIRWAELPGAFRSAEGRAFVVSLLALAVARASAARAPSGDAAPRVRAAVRDAARLALLTAGFMLPSLVAYLKVGGRANSLLPMTIGAAAILVRLGVAAAPALSATVLPPLGLSLLFGVVRPEVPISDAQHAAAARRLERTASIVRSELAAGRSTLYYDGTAAWILAGARTVPLDRWQTIQELVLGGHEEVNLFRARLANGYYGSVVLGAQVLSQRYSSDARTLRAILSEHFVRLTPGRLEDEDEGTPLLFRYLPAREPGVR